MKLTSDCTTESNVQLAKAANIKPLGRERYLPGGFAMGIRLDHAKLLPVGKRQEEVLSIDKTGTMAL